MTNQDKRKYCSGCDNDYYNHDGHSTTGECWMLKKAKVMKLFAISWWTPMDKKENFRTVTALSCRIQIGSTLYLKKLPEHLRRK